MKVLFTHKVLEACPRGLAAGTCPWEGGRPARGLSPRGAQAVRRVVGTAGDGPRVGRHASFQIADPLVSFVPYASVEPAEITVFIQPVIFFLLFFFLTLTEREFCMLWKFNHFKFSVLIGVFVKRMSNLFMHALL